MEISEPENQREGPTMKRIAVLALAVACAAGCKVQDETWGGLVTPNAGLLIVLDESASSWRRGREVGKGIATEYMKMRYVGQGSPITLLVGGQGAEWIADSYGKRRKEVQEQLRRECETEGREGEWGTDICAMLDRVQGFIADAGESRVTVVIVSDFVADQARGTSGQATSSYRDPAGFQWSVAHPEALKLRFYFTSDAQMESLRQAWGSQLAQADVKWFRPTHTPRGEDLK